MRERHTAATALPEAESVTHSIRLRIPGLSPDYNGGEGEFILHGVTIREIDWDTVAKGMGREHLPDALIAEIDSAAFRYDVAEIIATRIERS